jgi:hypothetical protein
MPQVFFKAGKMNIMILKGCVIFQNIVPIRHTIDITIKASEI